MGNIATEASRVTVVAYEEQSGNPAAIASRWQHFSKSGGFYQESPAGAVLRLLTSDDLSASLGGFTTTATAGGTTTLTAASARVHEFTGATTQDCVLPDATTLAVGREFLIRNLSTGVVTVKANGGATLLTLSANQEVLLVCKTIGTAAGTWSSQAITGTGAFVLATSPTLTTPAIIGATVITGNADVVQLKVTGNATQSTNPYIVRFEDSANAALWQLAATGQETYSRDAGTNNIPPVMIVVHNSTGVIAAGFGTGLELRGQDSTTASVPMARLLTLWTTATHASRKTRSALTSYDTSERSCIGWGANGAALVGFYSVSAAPVAQPAAPTTALTTVTFTAPGTPDYAVQNLTNVGGYGFVTQDEGNTVLSVIANLQARVNDVVTKLQTLGLIA